MASKLFISAKEVAKELEVCVSFDPSVKCGIGTKRFRCCQRKNQP